MTAMTDQMNAVPPLSLATQDADPDAFAQQLGGSFERFGFAIIADHCIGPALIDQAWAATKTFFAQPEAAKLSYKSPKGGARGYTPFGIEIAKDATEKRYLIIGTIRREHRSAIITYRIRARCPTPILPVDAGPSIRRRVRAYP